MKYKEGDKVLYTREDGLAEPVEALIVNCECGVHYPYQISYKYKGGVINELASDEELSPLEPEQLRQREQFFTDALEKPPTKGELHRQICEDLNKTYIKKNTDYGDSYGALRAEYSDSILIRVFDKYSRLKTLLGGNKALVEDESVEDTLLDMANYCIMEVVERRLSDGKNAD